MPAHKHRVKRLRQSVKRNEHNTQIKSKIKTLTKKIEAEEMQEAKQAKVREAVSVIDKAAKKGVLHKRTAARKISRLVKQATTTA